MVSQTNSSIIAHHQGSSERISLVTPIVEASVSTLENTGGVATLSSVPADEGKVCAVGASDREVVYHIDGSKVTK